jgi:hypothetical protein
MVSPMALETARIIEAIIPDEAAGSSTRMLVCRRVAPSAYEACLRERGTEAIASSLSDEISGIIIIPITIPGDNALKPAIPGINDCKNGVTTVRAKKPYTTVGIDASNSRMGLIMLRNVEIAYSLSK